MWGLLPERRGRREEATADLGPSEQSVWAEPCIRKDLNKQNASLWKHSAFSKALFRKIIKNSDSTLQVFMTRKGKVGLRYSASKKKLPELKAETRPRGRGPCVSGLALTPPLGHSAHTAPT